MHSLPWHRSRLQSPADPRPAALLFLSVALLMSCGGGEHERADGEKRSSAAAEQRERGKGGASAETAGLRTINGTELYVKEIGDGLPIIVLHGGPGWDHSILLQHLAPLAADHRLIFFDQRACGRSSIADVDDAEMTIEQMVEDIEGVRRDRRRDRVALLGHSFGGRLALRYALKYPDHLSHLVLMSSTAASSEYIDRVNQAMQERLTEEDRLERDRLIAAGAFSGESPEAYQDAMRLIVRANFHDPAKVDRLQFYLPDHYTERGERINALITGATPYDFYAELPAVPVPTLILRGAAEILPAGAPRRIHEQIPDSRLVTLDECGHFPFAECPDLLLAAVRKFVR